MTKVYKWDQEAGKPKLRDVNCDGKWCNETLSYPDEIEGAGWIVVFQGTAEDPLEWHLCPDCARDVAERLEAR